ncbi:MAG: 3-dehydroquinate synthase [Sandaracinaceae bacterium]|nr:3-dehydroquinate synthase [Myxococcales bacterium]MCB9657055.1 3-dehydroquinate synthase [Sandaracinaceae bacterium]
MRTIYLSGPMGAGKSTVARALGQQLGRPVIDLDQRIEAAAGTSITRIFAERGEAAFRQLEAEHARATASEGAVVALGGGALTQDALRHDLLERGLVVTLRADTDELLKRVGDATDRPLLAGLSPEQRRERLEGLLSARASAYAEAHLTVDTGLATAEQAALQVAQASEDVMVVVPLGERTYRVEIGAGVRERVGARVTEASKGDVVLVHDVPDPVQRPWPRDVAERVEAAGRRCVSVCLEDGERFKHVQSVETIWDAALDAGVDRHALVLGVGGGVVGDLTGFAASTLLRGVALGQVPTTLLSMVDSSVGGKTGFNRPRGKNLVGTFYQPSFVLCDVLTLATLSDDERISGLAEVVKSAWLDGEAAVAQLEEDAAALRVGEREATIRAIEMSVRLKARVVRQDEREGGKRMWLNLGHTVGHGLEAAHDYVGLRHGEAVALGMIAALRVGVAQGTTDATSVARLTELLRTLGLPVDLDDRLSDAALDFVASDKKKSGGLVRFVVPGRPGDTRVVPLSLGAIRAAVRRS